MKIREDKERLEKERETMEADYEKIRLSIEKNVEEKWDQCRDHFKR